MIFKKFPISNFQFPIPARQVGFTLVEMLIAVGLFALVASISIGAILSIFDANNRSRSSKTVVDNLNLAVEDMTRVVRFGTNYHSCDDDDLDEPNNCNTEQDSDILAVTFEGNIIVYRLCGTTIKRSDNGEENCSSTDMKAITSTDTVIEYLRFYVFGTNATDQFQPYVVAVIEGYVGSNSTRQSSFSIQTIMSQRALDI
ncbi:MAG: hypothetical protein A3A96_04495 [Candidatus Zambryskibacteria bacterium RIFCSPLOWO2_01_FULL_39_39]|uniref:Type II secretion system protein J n=1 Tax=Candidatus Zambryskibacteria bacterium RIFCSPLOWO2_01_FULL_39_39 TaxID=1802758 RepID=A0A1G2TX17_9BACT|nr:MAG: hypothetical protein UT00_C0028G0004 [Parcubacteria group bacterium GW2011_GWA1_38_7]OHA95354.1 MAG: hypothetical protein A3B88_02660 [Candidatus Zambryskibacteria bacterium RIFCSPHIGHO2_02_FULL_39_19]OHA97968.1 MAG: hypothetical protein A3F20_04300 [Candidatus Zambryskibacteria bacterium RIFCSPHIGHO2_12_FULL_39_21]OHB01784.1 MAG: hypothetical protein A3A96_04495 [Candidatus Zambryskibacteria bacterium RIFCSPLOWO2_01_FULL_39_39]